jgi:hypothetical protein
MKFLKKLKLFLTPNIFSIFNFIKNIREVIITILIIFISTVTGILILGILGWLYSYFFIPNLDSNDYPKLGFLLILATILLVYIITLIIKLPSKCYLRWRRIEKEFK